MVPAMRASVEFHAACLPASVSSAHTAARGAWISAVTWVDMRKVVRVLSARMVMVGSGVHLPSMRHPAD